MSSIAAETLTVAQPGLIRKKIHNQLLNPTTQQFLLSSGLKPGMTVLDVGCGIGMMSCWLAKIVGPQGRVIGIDPNPDHIEIARELALEHNIKNLELRTMRIGQIHQLPERFDLVYCRFLMIHLQNPYAMIQAIYDQLDDEGVFACESAILGHEFCYPEVAAFDRWRQLNHDVFEKMDKDPQSGKKLYSMMFDAGFRKLTGKIFQPILSTREERQEMLLHDLLEQEHAFVASGLATESEIDELVIELRELVEDDSHFIAYAQSCQISGIK